MTGVKSRLATGGKKYLSYSLTNREPEVHLQTAALTSAGPFGIIKRQNSQAQSTDVTVQNFGGCEVQTMFSYFNLLISLMAAYVENSKMANKAKLC